MRTLSEEEMREERLHYFLHAKEWFPLNSEERAIVSRAYDLIHEMNSRIEKINKEHGREKV